MVTFLLSQAAPVGESESQTRQFARVVFADLLLQRDNDCIFY